MCVWCGRLRPNWMTRVLGPLCNWPMAIQRYASFWSVSDWCHLVSSTNFETFHFHPPNALKRQVLPKVALFTPLANRSWGFPREAKVYLRGANVTSFTVKGVEWIGLRADCKLDGSKANISGGDWKLRKLGCKNAWGKNIFIRIPLDIWYENKNHKSSTFNPKIHRWETLRCCQDFQFVSHSLDLEKWFHNMVRGSTPAAFVDVKNPHGTLRLCPKHGLELCRSRK